MSGAGATAGGAVWAVGGRLTAQLVQFGFGILVARLLMPSDFGLAASIYAVTGFALILLDLGLGAAVIRWKDPSQVDLSTMFWLNLGNGVVFEILIILGAPLLAGFYGQPVLLQLAPLAGLAFLLSVGAVHQALLARAMRFRALAVIGALGSISASVSTLLMALAGFGVLSLTLGPAVQAGVTSVLLLSASRWRPSLAFSGRSLTQVWRFSVGVLGAQSTEYVAQNLDNVLLGRTSGPAALGVYNRAFSLMLIPVNQITGALGGVVFPMLVNVRDDHERLLVAYRRSAHVIFAVVAPILTLLAATAWLLVPLLYGEVWSGTIVPLQWLCLAGTARVVTLTTAWLLQTVDRTALMFRLALVEAGLTAVGIVIGLPFGPSGVAAGVAIAGIVYLPMNLNLALRAAGGGASALASDMARVLLACLIAAAAAGACLLLTSGWPPVARMLVCCVVFGVVYASSCALIDGQLLREYRAMTRMRRGR